MNFKLLIFLQKSKYGPISLNSGSWELKGPSRSGVSLGMGRTDRTALQACALQLSGAASCCMFVHNSLEDYKKTCRSQMHGKVKLYTSAKRMSRSYYISHSEWKRKKKTDKKIEWFQRDSHPLYCRKETQPSETQRGTLSWMDSPAQRASTYREWICIGIQCVQDFRPS